jgi:hypothetical protein
VLNRPLTNKLLLGAVLSSLVAVVTLACRQAWPMEPLTLDDFHGYPDPRQAMEEWLTYTTAKYEPCTSCDFNSDRNSLWYGFAYLYPCSPDYFGEVLEPCGSGVDCWDVFTPKTLCDVDVTSRATPLGDTTHRYIIECLGTVDCHREHRPPEDCCKLVYAVPGPDPICRETIWYQEGATRSKWAREASLARTKEKAKRSN